MSTISGSLIQAALESSRIRRKVLHWGIDSNAKSLVAEYGDPLLNDFEVDAKIVAFLGTKIRC